MTEQTPAIASEFTRLRTALAEADERADKLARRIFDADKGLQEEMETARVLTEQLQRAVEALETLADCSRAIVHVDGGGDDASTDAYEMFWDAQKQAHTVLASIQSGKDMADG